MRKSIMTGVFLCITGLFTVNGQPQRQRSGGSPDKSGDAELMALQAQTIPKFVQRVYEDSVTGKTMEYNLFIPENYDSTQTYPLLLFIADASTVNQDVTVPLKQGYGGVVWASDEDQAKHPSFILVPQFVTQTVSDNWSTSYEVEMVIRLLESVKEAYSIDSNRLYTTGQSMGGMMSMYYNIVHPDLFAASLFVGCQWDTSKMGGFKRDKFFYIVGAGDPKASVGMAELKKVLENEGARFSQAEWDAKLPERQQQENVQKLLAQGNDINLITFTLGSVLLEGGAGNEHMYSFDYAYRLEAVRDWLFRQSK
ncbi:MAG: prolyl oligopeptidase family serine peptidase [Rikenellaceae bacterium]|nr:prolyl oligopeptidase family serine peptidase [Rikenellaceae bacterium]